MREDLEEFIEWLKDCGEDVFFAFDNTDEAIERFLKYKKESEGEDESN